LDIQLVNYYYYYYY